MLGRKQFWEKPFSVCALGILLAIVLLPYAKNGFWADDALNSQTWGMVNRFNTTVGDFAYRVCRAWLVDYGRILLPWPAIYGFFYIFRDVLAARLADMALFIGHLSITVYLLRRIGINWRTLGLFLLALMGLLQIRDYGDPLAAYAGFSQVVGVLLMASFILLQKWHETKSPVWLAASSALAALSMACYEVNIVYLPIALVIVIASHNQRVMRDIFITAAPFAVFMAISFYVKSIAVTPYDGSTFGNLRDIPVTFLKQLVATLPGSFYAFIGHANFPFSEILKGAVTSWLAWLVLLLWSVLTLAIIRHKRVAQPGTQVAVLAAAMLLFVPPALISVSIKYQALLTWGTGHVPVYYQCLGLAFVIAAMVDRFLTAVQPKLAFVIVPLLGVYIALNWQLNMLHSSALDVAFREPRESFVKALHEGLFNDIRDGDVVKIEGLPMYINGNLIYQAIEKNVSTPNEPATAAWFPSPPRPDAKTFSLQREPSPSNQWKVVEQ